MKSLIRSTVYVCALSLFLAIFASAQSGPNVDTENSDKEKVAKTASLNGNNPILNLAGKVSVVVIKSAAKTAWATTKFAAKDVAKPILVGVAKPLLLKAAPQVTVFVLKLTGNSLKKGIPIATKLGMTYLRAKLPL